MKCVVQRPFEAEGRQLASGEAVDASAWGERRVRQLVAQRYLAPASRGKPKTETAPTQAATNGQGG